MPLPTRPLKTHPEIKTATQPGPARYQKMAPVLLKKQHVQLFNAEVEESGQLPYQGGN